MSTTGPCHICGKPTDCASVDVTDFLCLDCNDGPLEAHVCSPKCGRGQSATRRRHLHQLERDFERRLILVLSWPVTAWFLIRSARDTVRAIRYHVKASR